MYKIINGKLKGKEKVLRAVDRWFVEMLDNGWLESHGVEPFWQNYYAMEYNGKIVSFLIYERCMDFGHIKGAWTHPDHRRKGLYNQLWKALVDRERQRKKIREIHSGYHIKNKISEAMQQKQGRKITRSEDRDFNHSVFAL